MNHSALVLEVENLTKRFDSKTVLEDLSFSVHQNEAFGLLGPNGAGKTTLIRMILNILKPDSGEIEVLGEVFSEGIKKQIGYLPEEGGLYKKSRILDCIEYFSRLKGVKDSHAKAEAWLQKMDLLDYKNKNVETLSKGMHRKLQFILAVIHDPAILIIDEPFYGLDPVNKNLLKDLLLELKAKGTTILLSTHQMDEVEKMCDRLLMIHRGKPMLYGPLNEIKSRYGLSIALDYEGKLPASVEGVKTINDYGNVAELTLEKEVDSQRILKTLIQKVTLKKFEIRSTPLNEIFIDIVKYDQQ